MLELPRSVNGLRSRYCGRTVSVFPLDPRLRLILNVSKLLVHGDWLDVSGLEGDTTQQVAVYSGSFELREVDVLFQRVEGSRPIQDAAMFTLHLVNITGGVPDASWIAGDYTTAETALDAFWTTMKAHYTLAIALAGYRWSADGPAFKPFGSSNSPTLRNTARNVLGTHDVEILPPQVAASVTEVTAAKYTAHNVEGVGDQLRNRWGRFYMPPPAVDKIQNGRFTAAFCTALAGATQTLYNALRAADLIPVMYSPTTGSAWSVDSIHVDDIVDVIRSRRFVTPLTRTPLTLT